MWIRTDRWFETADEDDKATSVKESARLLRGFTCDSLHEWRSSGRGENCGITSSMHDIQLRQILRDAEVANAISAVVHG